MNAGDGTKGRTYAKPTPLLISVIMVSNSCHTYMVDRLVYSTQKNTRLFRKDCRGDRLGIILEKRFKHPGFLERRGLSRCVLSRSHIHRVYKLLELLNRISLLFNFGASGERGLYTFASMSAAESSAAKNSWYWKFGSRVTSFSNEMYC